MNDLKGVNIKAVQGLIFIHLHSCVCIRFICERNKIRWFRFGLCVKKPSGTLRESQKYFRTVAASHVALISSLKR